MLKLKKTSSKKNITYAVVLIVLFIGTGVVIYNNFFAGQSSNIASSDLVNIEEEEAEKIIESIDSFSEGELSFLSSKKFKELRDNFSEIKIDETGNKNLFFVPKEESKSKK